MTNFDLHILGWKAFEDLVACIFRDILGQTIQVFAEGQDGGRDAAFKGVAKNVIGKSLRRGTFCIQCKHTSKASINLPMILVDGELKKIKRLASQNLCETYLFVTNYSVPAEVAKEAERKIVDAGAGGAVIFGKETLNQIISENPRLRRLVPRIYGLGDLTQIITNQAYAQAKQVLESIAPDINCFVPTAAYRQCAHALQEHGFVLLLGEPASGKTMIANLMALSAADEWNLQTIMLSGPADFPRLWNPNDPGQFLWVDDAFGATQYSARSVSEWNLQLPNLKAAIKSGARVVFTSRDYIFAAAKNDLKISAFDLFDDSRVVINVEQFTPAERQMILYNHLKSGAQSREFKKSVKAFLEKAAEVPKFLPEISRRFGHPKFTSRVLATEKSVLDFFAHPVQVLADVVKTLASAEKAALGLVFMSEGKLAIPISSSSEVALLLDLIGVTLGEVKLALSSLDDSLLKRINEEGDQHWTFRHPTIRDAYASMVGANPELIDIYLKGVSTEKMLNEIVCGSTQIEGAKIIVPTDRYDQIIGRLRAYSPKPSIWSNPVTSFLSSRCDSKFLARYYDGADLITLIPSYVSAYNDQIKILAKLHLAKLLPEKVRLLAVQKIVERCMQDYSCTPFEFATFKALLTDEERKTAIVSITDKILKNPQEILDDLVSDWDGESDPAAIFYDLTGTLDLVELDDNFSLDQHDEAIAIKEKINEIECELNERYLSKEYEKLDTEDASEPPSEAISDQSIFDDVDE